MHGLTNLKICILLVSNPRFYLQEDGGMYRNGIVCCTYISIRRLVGGRVLMLMDVQHTLPYLYIPPSS